MDLNAMSIIESYSTQYFTFKLTSKPTATPQARSLVNAYDVMRRVHTSFIFLPPRLEYSRMYANHNTYNALLPFLEERQLGWTRGTANTNGKRFIDGMSKAFFLVQPIGLEKPKRQP